MVGYGDGSGAKVRPGAGRNGWRTAQAVNVLSAQRDEQPLTIDGDLLVTGDSEFGFGGGDYAYTNSVRRYAFTKGVGPQVRVTGSVIVR